MSIDAVRVVLNSNFGLSSTQTLVLMTMAFHADDEGRLAMSISNIAKQTCLSQSSVVTAINYLCDKRLLKRTLVYHLRERKPTEYMVML